METLNNTALGYIVLTLSFITLAEGIGKDNEMPMLDDPSISTNFGSSHPRGSVHLLCDFSSAACSGSCTVPSADT